MLFFPHNPTVYTLTTRCAIVIKVMSFLQQHSLPLTLTYTPYVVNLGVVYTILRMKIVYAMDFMESFNWILISGDFSIFATFAFNTLYTRVHTQHTQSHLQPLANNS